MTNERLRLGALLRGRGIEIGALHEPLPVPSRAHVTHVDRLPVEKLCRHYEELADCDLTQAAAGGRVGFRQQRFKFVDTTAQGRDELIGAVSSCGAAGISKNAAPPGLRTHDSEGR